MSFILLILTNFGYNKCTISDTKSSKCTISDTYLTNKKPRDFNPMQRPSRTIKHIKA